MNSNLSAEKAQQMANNAKEKLQGMWTSLRSMTIDEDHEGSFRLPPLPKAPSLDNAVGWENMVKTMFGSCTTGIPVDLPEECIRSPNSKDSTSPSSKTRSCEPLSPSREKEEFFYSQFLANDHSRAHHAVPNTRDTVDRSKVSLTKPFPMSSPSRRQSTVPPVLVQEIVPRRSDLQGEIAGTTSFDDGISAISAHTLEELARQQEPHTLGHVQSDLTSEGFETVDSKESSIFGGPSPLFRSKSASSHMDMPRNRSGLSKKSTGTKSTKSSSEFENVWRRDEQRYWQDLVEKDAIGRPTTPQARQQIMLQRVEALKQRSRSRDSGASPSNLKNASTPITAANSSFSGSHFSRHPHETLNFEAADLGSYDDDDDNDCEIITHVVYPDGNNDPDQLRSILVLNHETELGEI